MQHFRRTVRIGNQRPRHSRREVQCIQAGQSPLRGTSEGCIQEGFAKGTDEMKELMRSSKFVLWPEPSDDWNVKLAGTAGGVEAAYLSTVLSMDGQRNHEANDY